MDGCRNANSISPDVSRPWSGRRAIHESWVALRFTPPADRICAHGCNHENRTRSRGSSKGGLRLGACELRVSMPFPASRLAAAVGRSSEERSAAKRREKRRTVTARLGRAQRRRLAHCGREKEAFEITERARGTLKTGPCPERQKLSRAGRGSDFAYSERARKARIFARTSGVSKALPPWPAPGRTWNSEGTPTSRRRAWRRSLCARGTWSSWSP